MAEEDTMEVAPYEGRFTVYKKSETNSFEPRRYKVPGGEWVEAEPTAFTSPTTLDAIEGWPTRWPYKHYRAAKRALIEPGFETTVVEGEDGIEVHTSIGRVGFDSVE